MKVAPIVSTERISSVDALRGVALLGILVIHVSDFGSPGSFFPTAAIPGDDRGVNLVVWFVSQVLFEGKMRALFTMLFGASVILLTSRAEERVGAASSADIYYRRTLWLIGFGLLHAYFIWWGDILFHYGVFGLRLYPLRKVSAKALIIACLLILLAGAAIPIFKARRYQAMREKAVAAEALVAAGKALTDEQREAQRACRMALTNYLAQSVLWAMSDKLQFVADSAAGRTREPVTTEVCRDSAVGRTREPATN